jgi:signal transduction histidine kinase
MAELATTIAIDQDHAFLNKFADECEGRPRPGRAVKHLCVAAQDRDRKRKRLGSDQNLAECSLSNEALDNGQSELARWVGMASLDLVTVSIAHEVIQPLAAIVINGETCLRALDRAELNVERIRELAKRMIADARRASEIVDRVQNMATPQASRYSPLSFNEIVEESIVFLRHEFRSRDIDVSLDFASDLPHIVGDRTQLQQVIVNLAVNAAHAMTESMGTRHSILIRAALSSPETVRFSIEDSGPGIEPALLPHIFGGFFTTKNNGRGIGLSISQSIIEAHGGWIGADNNSILGGARFSFTLPVNVAD